MNVRTRLFGIYAGTVKRGALNAEGMRRCLSLGLFRLGPAEYVGYALQIDLAWSPGVFAGLCIFGQTATVRVTR